VPYNNAISAFSLNQLIVVSAPVEVTVVVAPLVAPVIVSPSVNVPEGTNIVNVVKLGIALIVETTPLVAPVIFSPVYAKLSYEDLSNWILEDNLNVRFQVQLHKIIWGEKKGV